MKSKLIILLLGILSPILMKAQLPEKAEDISPLLVGETIPDVVLKSPANSNHNFSSIVAEKPTVLLVYRGGWCPFCNAHLSEIQAVQTDVMTLGYQIVAVSPDSPEKLRATENKDELHYRLYSDGDGEFIQSLGIAFKAPENYSGILNEFSGGVNEGLLPVPAVFVVDQSGTILFEYINPNYKTRLSAKLLLAVLSNLDVNSSNQSK